MAVDYRKLDAVIVDFISGSCSSPLYDPHCQEEAKRLEQQHGGDRYLYIDRRLQALRKMGVIVYLKKAEAPNGKTGWYLTPAEPVECWARRTGITQNTAQEHNHGKPNNTEELILSEDEKALVLKYRAAAAAIDEAELFRRNVIQQAAAWLEYSERTGEGLTFSTFVNNFGYENKDCQVVYRHLEKVLKAAHPSGSPA